MNILIQVLVVATFHLVNCSISVTRGVYDVIFDKSVGGKCFEVYRANYVSSSSSCNCNSQGQYGTFSSGEGGVANCKMYPLGELLNRDVKQRF